AETAAELDRQLADPAYSERRPLAVEMLANLYRAQRRVEDERRLLERELRNAHITADKDAHQRLTTRFEQLGGSLRLAGHVSDWLRAHPLPWYDYAAPVSLDDPRLRNLSAVLENPGHQFSSY